MRQTPFDLITNFDNTLTVGDHCYEIFRNSGSEALEEGWKELYEDW